MALTDAEKKRRSRAKKSAKYHDHERETSRKRMAIYRAKNKAQKRAQQLKSLLSEGDKREIEGHVSRQKQHLLCDWFSYHNLKFDPKMIGDTKILNSFMTKVELHKIELQVAEFEISIIEDRDDGLNHDEYLHALQGHNGRGDKHAAPAAKVAPPAPSLAAQRAFDNRQLNNRHVAKIEPSDAQRSFDPRQAHQSQERQRQGQSPVTDALSLLLQSAPLVTDAEALSSDGSVEAKEEPPRISHLDEFERKMPAFPEGGRQYQHSSARDAPVSHRGRDAAAARPPVMPRNFSRLDLEYARLAGLDPSVQPAYASEAASNFDEAMGAAQARYADAAAAHAAAQAEYASLVAAGYNSSAPSAAASAMSSATANQGDATLEDPLLAAMQGLEGGLDEVVPRFEGGLDEVLAQERDDLLLRMDLEGFDIDMNGLGMETECFGAEAYTW